MLLATLLTLLVIFILVGAAINSLRHALLVFAVLPVAVTGGIFALFVRGMQFSPSTVTGFMAVLLLTLLHGVVVVSSIDGVRRQGAPVPIAIVKGALARLRLIFLTTLVLTCAFLPMAVTTGTGAEIQRPLATVVIGGVLTSSFTTLLLIPVVYKWIDSICQS
jgi:heavy metal efflux system protein